MWNITYNKTKIKKNVPKDVQAKIKGPFKEGQLRVCQQEGRIIKGYETSQLQNENVY